VYKRQEVLLETTMPPFFENKTGLKQGDLPSPKLFTLALQKVIQSINMVPSGIKIGKEQLSVLAYAVNCKKWNRNNTTFVETENTARNLGLHINQRKTKYDSVMEKQFKKNLHLREWRILNT
jgi:hypothetical protein